MGRKKGPFEVPPGHTKTYDKNKSVPNSPKLYVLQKNKSACLLCEFSYKFCFIGDNISAVSLQMKLHPR